MNDTNTEEMVACATCRSATRMTKGGQCPACDHRRMRLLQLVTRPGVLGAAGVEGGVRQYEGAAEWQTFVTASTDLAALAPGDDVEMRVTVPNLSVFLARRGDAVLAVAVEPQHPVVKVLRRTMRRVWWAKRSTTGGDDHG